MKALAIASSNLRRFLRERSNIFFVFILPIAIVVLIGAQFGDGGGGIRLGVVSDGDQLSERVIARLGKTERFGSRQDLVLAVERGGIDAGVVFPDDLGASVVEGGMPTIVFLARTGGGGAQFRSVVDSAMAEEAANELAIRFAIERGADRTVAEAVVAETMIEPISIETVDAGDRLFPADLGRFDFGASGQLVLFMFLTGLTGSTALIQTRQLGVSRRMLATPTAVGTIVVGEAIGRWVIVLVQGAYIMATTAVVFGVDWGDPIGALGLLGVFAWVGASAAMLVGSYFRNDQQAGAVAIIAGIGMAALGGSMIPRQLFSDTMQTVSLFIPHGWANRGFTELVIYDGTFRDVLDEMAALAAMAVVGMLIAARKLRRVLTH